MPIEDEIERIQQERNSEKARKEAEERRVQQEQEAESSRVRAQAQDKANIENEKQRRERQQRTEFVKQQTEKVLGESGVLDSLKRIENKYLRGNVKKHDLIYRREKAQVVLLWGNRFQVADGEIFAENGSASYSYIEAKVDPDTQSLTIVGDKETEFSKDKLTGTKDVEIALAEAYLEPKRVVVEPPEPERDYDDGGSDNCSCCRG